jgi:anaerobic selenocysteine-containing dehydrogenase
MGDRFFHRMGASRLERTICSSVGGAAGQFTTGNAQAANIEDLPRMQVVILWATNLVTTGVHAMPFVQQARDNGAKIVAIDPRVTRTTAFADWHLQPKPGTDGALALGMMHILVRDGLHDTAFLREHTVGWERLLHERLPEYTPAHVAAITGLAEADIETLAALYGSTRRSFIRLNYGVQRSRNGGMATRAIMLLPVLTGAMREKGGVCLGTGREVRGVDLRKLTRPDLLAGREPRTINMIRLGEALTAAVPPVKALFVWNAEPANCAPDTAMVRRGLARDDLFTVVHDTFFTDTCDYADIVLPADTALERTDVVGGYGHFVYALGTPAIPKQGESVDNSELFRRLAARMGYTDACFAQSDEAMLEELLDPAFNPLFEGVTLARLKAEGWVRGAVDSPRRAGMASGHWPTPSGKIEIESASLAAIGLDPLPAYTAAAVTDDPSYPLQVISAATHWFIGASFQHVPRLQALMARQTFEVAPADAQARGIETGDLCRLWNAQGEVFGHARVVDGLRPGVLGAPKQLQGSKQAGGLNINALVAQDEADMGRGPVFYSTFAQLEKADPRRVPARVA